MNRAAKLVAALAITLGGQAPAQVSRGAPARALILGVPFISWSEAASLDYANKNIVNPSSPASEGMVLKYWGRDLTSLKQSDATPPGWRERGGDGGGLDSLKADVARGIPVVVCLALTPIAHNPGPGAAVMMAMRDSGTAEAVERGGPASGVLGTMTALDTLRRWGEVIGTEALRESVFMACRVVIGYDDARKVVVLHDPSFGPAWEVSYAEFDAMWSFWNRFHLEIYPDDFARVVARRPPAPPYPARTASQRAAEDFVYGYALASVGRRDDAEARLKDGLAIPGLPVGYRHLMLLELARLAEARHDLATAIALYEQASVLLPQDPWPWLLLGGLYQRDPTAGQKGDSLLRRAAALCADSEAQTAVWNSLPHDVVIMPGCEESTPSQPAARLADGEIAFEVPGSGWTRQDGEQLGFVRVEVPGSRAQAIALWPVDVPADLRGLPQERQAAEYFAMERASPRDVPWSGFVERRRDIARRPYPTLSARIAVPSDAKHPVIGDVLFVLVFPGDFATRQRFYVVMWTDYHPASDRGAGLSALETFVSRLRVR